MKITVNLPQLGESVDSGTIVAWLVKVGDSVAIEQAIAEISTDKVDTEIPSPAAGTVVALLAATEETVAVGAPILEIETGADEGDAVPAPQAAATAAAADRGPASTPVSTPVSTTVAAVPASTGTTVHSTANMRLSPLVKRRLRESGLDPTTIVGTGAGGLITVDDVEAAASQGAGAARPEPTTTRRVVRPGDRVEPLTRTRKVIAERMLASLQTTAQLTSAVEADVTRLMSLRAEIRDVAKARYGVSISPLAFIAHATVRTLADHPVLNASIDTDAGEVIYHHGVGLGVAIDAPQGLIVPVVRNAEDLDPIGLQQRIVDLAARARDKRLTPDDLGGGTFTITNTGSRGSLFDTPILNPPEVGILATPTIEKRPVVVTREDGDVFAIRWRTYLCLSYDHRLVDGADAARFLTDLAGRLDTSDWGPQIEELRAAARA